MTKKEKIKVAKGWVVLTGDKKRVECSFPAKTEAREYALQFYGSQVVPAIITYLIPKKSNNKEQS